MSKRKEEIYQINPIILKQYIESINSFKEPMNKLKKYIYEDNQDIRLLDSIKNIINEMNKYNEIKNIDKYKLNIDIIKQLMNENNGIITTRILEPLNISRKYIRIMKEKKEIEMISRGIYLNPNFFEDSYYSFQQKYKKAIFSHMNALYFYEMTEEFPSNYTITVPRKYHIDKINKKHNVFYISEELYELGMIDVKTPSGNIVKAYDKERCICDIIRSKNRMDPEQVIYSIREYIKSKDKDLIKLSNYATKMGIKDKVMNYIELIY